MNESEFKTKLEHMISACNFNIDGDKILRWTKETLSKFEVSIPRCKTCGEPLIDNLDNLGKCLCFNCNQQKLFLDKRIVNI